MSSLRPALAALCLWLFLPHALPVLAADPEPAPEPAQAQPEIRPQLPERSMEDETALERQLPKNQQQQLVEGLKENGDIRMSDTAPKDELKQGEIDFKVDSRFFYI